MNTRANPGHGTGDHCAICCEPVFYGIHDTITSNSCQHTIHAKCYKDLTCAGGLKACAFFTCPTCNKKTFHNKLQISGFGLPPPDTAECKNKTTVIRDNIIFRIIELAANLTGMNPNHPVLKHIFVVYKLDTL